MKTVRLSRELAKFEADKLKGERLDAHSYNQVIREDAIISDVSGHFKAALFKQRIPAHVSRSAYEFLRTVSARPSGRGTYIRKGSLMPRVRKDGSPSRRLEVPKPVLVAHGGFGDQLGFLKGKATKWTNDHPEILEGVMVLVQLVDEWFQTELPTQYACQLEAALPIPGKFKLTPAFTTLTVNRDNRAAAHRDAGNVRGGLGCLTTHGAFRGGIFIMPRYFLGLDVQPGDLLIADTHELHANGPIDGERVSTVYYAHASNVPRELK